MTAPESLVSPASKPKGCPTWLWIAHRQTARGDRPRSWYWLQCAEARFDTDAFRGLECGPSPVEPVVSEDRDPKAWAKYRAAWNANAERRLMLERYRRALAEHDPHGPTMQACERALGTFRTWNAPAWMTWWAADLANVRTGRAS